MEVYLAEHSGFCFGVKRAINMTLSAVKKTKTKVYTYGPLIHNPQVVSEFKKQGIIATTDISKVKPDSSVIIRTHGVSPEVIEKFKKKKLHIIDATCPFVKKAQRIVERLVKENYQVVIVGESEHPEVKGIQGYAKNKAIVIRSVSDAKNIQKFSKIGVVVQTTQSIEDFKNIIPYLLDKAPEVKVFNTICDATEKTQYSALKLAKKVDIIIVIGGHNSANTKHLAEVCKLAGSVTYHIENVSELKEEWLKGKHKVGITAGASTPEWIIKEVLKKLKKG